MNKPITIRLDNHQFKILCSYRQREVIAIGDQFIHETQSIIFEEFFKSPEDLTCNILILNGAWKDLQYTAIIGTMSLFLVGYTLEGVRVPLGLSGVRKSDNIETF